MCLSGYYSSYSEWLKRRGGGESEGKTLYIYTYNVTEIIYSGILRRVPLSLSVEFRFVFIFI